MAGKAKLTETMKQFIDYYIMTNSSTEAARLAGYGKSPASSAWRLMRYPAVQAALAERRKELEGLEIAGAEEIKEYWSSIMRGEELESHFSIKRNEYFRVTPNSARLRASEDLARAHGAFLKGNIEKESLDLDIIWVDDYGEDEDYEKIEESDESEIRKVME